MAALLGEEMPLSSITLEGEHSLEVQSYAPREMLSGTVNVEGFGAGWYVPGHPQPAVYRSLAPIWADRSFRSLAPKLGSGAIFAALRSATPGLPVEESGVPPFDSGQYMFMHNGAIEGFRHTAMRPLRDSLGDLAYSGLLGTTDSETIFACALDRVEEMGVARALEQTARFVAEVCAGLGVHASLNLGLTDGREMAFLRYSTFGPGNSLYWLEDGERFLGSVVVASERLDGDGGWREVPDGHLLTVNKQGVTVRPFTERASEWRD